MLNTRNQDWEHDILRFCQSHPECSFNFSELPFVFEEHYEACKELFETIAHCYEKERGEKVTKKMLEEAWNEFREKEWS